MPPMTPKDFADRCRDIVETQRGHEAHRSLDLLTNQVLRELGYGEGVQILEAEVASWHKAADPYPYPPGPCPSCEG